MDIQKELKLFKRCSKKVLEKDVAVSSMSTIYLANQLERYINPALDMSLIFRYILDINSENHFSSIRSDVISREQNSDDKVQHEYTHAIMLNKLALLFTYRGQGDGKSMDPEVAKDFLILGDEQSYFGEELSELNNTLVEELCPDVVKLS